MTPKDKPESSLNAKPNISLLTILFYLLVIIYIFAAGYISDWTIKYVNEILSLKLRMYVFIVPMIFHIVFGFVIRFHFLAASGTVYKVDASYRVILFLLVPILAINLYYLYDYYIWGTRIVPYSALSAHLYQILLGYLTALSLFRQDRSLPEDQVV